MPGPTTAKAKNPLEALRDKASEKLGDLIFAVQEGRDNIIDRADRELKTVCTDDFARFKNVAVHKAQEAMMTFIGKLKAGGEMCLSEVVRNLLTTEIHKLLGNHNSQFATNDGQLTVLGVKALETNMKKLGHPCGQQCSSSLLNGNLPEVKALQALPFQNVKDGVGHTIQRSYTTTLPAGQDIDKLFDTLRKNFPQYIDPQAAHFYTLHPGGLNKQDLIPIQLHINAPGQEIAAAGMLTGVRVVRVDPQQHSMTFRTLKYHPEAGEITFSFKKLPDGKIEFNNASQAKSGSYGAIAGYELFGRDQQTATWTGLLQRFAHATGTNNISIQTKYKEL